MNFYRISKFSAKITKEPLLLLFICVTAYSNNPLGFLFFQPEVPESRGRRIGKGAGRNPAMWVAGGEGKEARELEGTTAHL